MKKTSFSVLMSMLTALLILAGCTEKLSETIPVTSSSDEAVALFEKGYEAGTKAKIKTATDYYKEALEKDNDFFMANYQLSIMHMYFKRMEQFNITAEKAINCAAKLSKGEELMREMLTLYKEDKKEEAAVHGEEIIDLYPNDTRAYFPLAAHYSIMGNDEKLIGVLEQQMVTGDLPGMSYNSMGYAYMRLGKMEKALEAFDKYIELQPNDANPYDSKGDYFMKMEDYESALKHYKKAFSIDTTFTASKNKAMKVKALMKEMMEKEGEEKE